MIAHYLRSYSWKAAFDLEILILLLNATHFVVDPEDVRDVDPDLDDVDRVGKGQLELGVGGRKTEGLRGSLAAHPLSRGQRERQVQPGEQEQDMPHFGTVVPSLA